MEPKQTALNPFSGYQKFIIAMLALLQFTVILDFMVLSPLGDILMKSLDIIPARFGLVVSSYAFSAGISGILAAGFADKIDKYNLFVFGSTVAIIMVLIYTNITSIPLWQVILINMIMFMGIMSRMIPATTLTTSVPQMKDRGAFMSINSSLQQMAGGFAAICAGLIVTQPTKHSPLQHYNMLGYVVSLVIVICAFLVFRVYKMVKGEQEGYTIPVQGG
ncbi:MFS transporter [Asinibacterium sp. OR53]|uniref:MFS transporter n=1 Tax=Asinibacterium sp. OR53 TaxID=925409 RepID=UPI000478A1E6|nr:MFS transporter [Asinibacterium sp. OR53]